jgi:hypothetical protein
MRCDAYSTNEPVQLLAVWLSSYTHSAAELCDRLVTLACYSA